MRPSRVRVLATGVIAGLIGFGVISLGFLILDAATGRAIGFTPSLLAASLFRGVTNACDVHPQAAPILAYSAVHLFVFLVLGWFTTWLFSLTTHRPSFWMAALFMFLFVAFHLYGAVLSILAPVSGCFSLYHILGATTTASLAMIVYLLRKYRGLSSLVAQEERQ